MQIANGKTFTLNINTAGTGLNVYQILAKTIVAAKAGGMSVSIQSDAVNTSGTKWQVDLTNKGDVLDTDKFGALVPGEQPDVGVINDLKDAMQGPAKLLNQVNQTATDAAQGIEDAANSLYKKMIYAGLVVIAVLALWEVNKIT